MGIVHSGGPRNLILQMKQLSSINTFIETGTNYAATSIWAAEHFKRVVTIEGYEPLYRDAVAKYGSRSNVEFRFGDSGTDLEKVVGTLTEPAIFWLDAHWCGTETFGVASECPVAAEMNAINRSALNHIVMIDDARLFLEPPKPPHVATHWPGLAELMPLLNNDSRNRYVAVTQDVIIAVSTPEKAGLIECLRSQPEPDYRPSAPSIPRRALDRLTRSFGNHQ